MMAPARSLGRSSATASLRARAGVGARSADDADGDTRERRDDAPGQAARDVRRLRERADEHHPFDRADVAEQLLAHLIGRPAQGDRVEQVVGNGGTHPDDVAARRGRVAALALLLEAAVLEDVGELGDAKVEAERVPAGLERACAVVVDDADADDAGIEVGSAAP
jgi:hypothetical protein